MCIWKYVTYFLHDGWITFSMHEIYINLFSMRKTTLFHVSKFLKKKLTNVSPWTKYNKGRRCLESFYHTKYVGVIYNICWILGKLWQGTKVKCNLLICYANEIISSHVCLQYTMWMIFKPIVKLSSLEYRLRTSMCNMRGAGVAAVERQVEFPMLEWLCTTGAQIL